MWIYSEWGCPCSDAAKLLAKMRRNPRDWRIEDLKVVASSLGIDHDQHGTIQVIFRHASAGRPSVPARRPIKPLLAVIAGASVMAVRLHAERGRHERTQRVFAPSLREELEQGISQLDFELSLHSAGRARTLIGIISLGTLVFVWETARLNGDPAPWMMLAMNLVWVFPIIWYSAVAEKEACEKVMQRRRALESMRAALVD